MNVQYRVKFFYFNPLSHVDNIMEKPAINIWSGQAESLVVGYSADGFFVKTLMHDINHVTLNFVLVLEIAFFGMIKSTKYTQTLFDSLPLIHLYRIV